MLIFIFLECGERMLYKLALQDKNEDWNMMSRLGRPLIDETQ